MHRLWSISIAAACALAACGGSGAPITNHATGGGASEVRAIDWQNHTYELGQLGAVTVVNGSADFAISDDGKAVATGTSNGNYHVEPPLFADVNGDGVEDAIISAATATGGTGHFSEIDVYSVRDHKIVDLATISGGDRGDGGIRKVALDGTAILVERNVLAEGDGICCASKTQHERWLWQHGELAEDIAARKPGTATP